MPWRAGPKQAQPSHTLAEVHDEILSNPAPILLRCRPAARGRNEFLGRGRGVRRPSRVAHALRRKSQSTTLQNCLAQPRPVDGGTRAETARETTLAITQARGSVTRNRRHRAKNQKITVYSLCRTLFFQKAP